MEASTPEQKLAEHRYNRRQLKRQLIWFAVIAGCLAVASPSVDRYLRTYVWNPNDPLGNVSDADKSPDNYLAARSQYVLSFNKSKKIANWVAWQLNRDWLADKPTRTEDFRPDTELPKNYSANPDEYDQQPYDKGHFCPAADRQKTEEDISATFLMSNIVPQRKSVNSGPWLSLEKFCREQARKGKDLYIIAGTTGNLGTIGKGVTVPESFWKVVLINNTEHQNFSLFTKVIAVRMSNRLQSVSANWDNSEYLTSVGSIEQAAHLNLLKELPSLVTAKIRDQRSATAKDL